MARFLIGIVGLGKNVHSQCFLDMARALAAALRRLGHEVEYASPGVKPGRMILFGANNLSEDDEHPLLPEDSIIFNSEQLAAVKQPEFFLQNYLKYRKLTVWDYSAANLKSLRDLGIERAVHCPIGYVPEMTTIEPVEDEDIDVLFVGSVAGSRREILDALDKTELRCERLFNCYEKERDAYIARAKVVINIHYYPNGVFEIFRVSHLLANKKCVVTEAGGCDPDLEQLASATCVYVPRKDIIETCRALVKADHVRRSQAERGHELFKKLDFAAHVKRALELSS